MSYLRPYGVTLLAMASGKRYEAKGTRIRLGRGRECEVQPVETSDTIVSRIHAELTVGPSGGLVLRDAQSKNGTFLNGERIVQPMPVRLGDKIMLGQGGPVLLVEGMGTAPQKIALGQKTVMGMISDALAQAKEERKKGGRGSTAFMKAIAGERRLRWLSRLMLILVLSLGGGVYGVYWLLSQQLEHTQQALRTAEDSSRAESERLRRELAAARAAAQQSVGRHADVIAASRDRDIALIKIRGYQGGHLTAIDWGGTKARQGGPAALIGYPAGCAGRGCAAAALQPGADANGDRTLGSGNPAHAEVLATSWSMLSSFAKS